MKVYIITVDGGFPKENLYVLSSQKRAVKTMENIFNDKLKKYQQMYGDENIQITQTDTMIKIVFDDNIDVNGFIKWEVETHNVY